MIRIIILLMFCMLTGCAQQKNSLPEISGKSEPLNSPVIIQELTSNV